MPRIVVGVDGSQASLQALGWAAAEARRRGAVLDVVHAWHMPYVGPDHYLAGYASEGLFERDARAVLDRALAETGLTGAAGVEPILVHDGAARALLDTAKGADLLVVGRRGGGGFAGLLLGSVSQQVSLHTPCPVAIIPGSTE